MAKNLNGAVFCFSRMSEKEIVFIPGRKLRKWQARQIFVLAEHRNEIKNGKFIIRPHYWSEVGCMDCLHAAISGSAIRLVQALLPAGTSFNGSRLT